MPRSHEKLKFSELRVGIFMLAALVLTGFLILNSSGNFNPFERKMRLKTRFQTADGLHPGADVQLAGVSIGKVEDVKFLPLDEQTNKPRCILCETWDSDMEAQLTGVSRNRFPNAFWRV